MEHSDSELLDFLDFLSGDYTGLVQLRISSTGRGWRLHECEDGYGSVREAIEAFMQEQARG